MVVTPVKRRSSDLGLLSMAVPIPGTVGTQRAYFELKYFKIVKMRDAKYSLKMAAEKWRQIFPFLNALYS